MKTPKSLLHRLSISLLVSSFWFITTAGSINPSQAIVSKQSNIQSYAQPTEVRSLTPLAKLKLKDQLSRFFSAFKPRSGKSNSAIDPSPKDPIKTLAKTGAIFAGSSFILLPLAISFFMGVAAAIYPILFVLFSIVAMVLAIVTIAKIKNSGENERYKKTKRLAYWSMPPFFILLGFLALVGIFIAMFN